MSNVATTKKAAATKQAIALHLTNPPMEGPQVRHAQQLLAKNPYGHFEVGGIDGVYGPATAAATLRAKQELGFENPDRSFGPTLEAMLAGTMKLPADFEARREARAHDNARDATIRAKIVEYARWGCANEPSIHYQQSRPIDGLREPKKLPLNTDCSGFATDCYKWAGGPDPCGNGFSGAGWTGDMLHAGSHIHQSQIQPGDLLVFGGAPAHQHVCVVVKGGADPQVVSHGQEKGPFLISFSQEAAAHAGQPVFWLSYLQ
jgi:cell wall-associated NlpC family hydrolase